MEGEEGKENLGHRGIHSLGTITRCTVAFYSMTLFWHKNKSIFPEAQMRIEASEERRDNKQTRERLMNFIFQIVLQRSRNSDGVSNNKPQLPTSSRAKSDGRK